MSRTWMRLTIVVLAVAACAAAMGQATREATHVLVLPVRDATGRQPQLVLEKATASIALALEDTGAYTVVSREDMEREMRALGLQPPLSKDEQLRLAKRLQADKVCISILHELSVDRRSGAAVCSIEIRMLDVRAEEVLTGGVGTARTKAIPGWAGDIAPVINEALREAASNAVRAMERSAVPHGVVMMVDDSGQVHINLGRKDGVKLGQEMIVMRGFYKRELDQTILRKIGTLQVRSVFTDRCTAVVTSGMAPRTGDRVYVVYRPIAVQRKMARARKITRGARVLAALGALVGIAAVGLGGHRTSAPAVEAYLYQTTCGADPYLRVKVNQPHVVPDPSKIRAHIFFRDTRPTPRFEDPAYIVAVVQRATRVKFDDDMTPEPDINVTDEWTYIGRDGDEEDASYDITYNHRPLVPGTTYWYVVRRIVSPYEPVIPIAQQKKGRAKQVEWADEEWEFDPPTMLSDPSSPTKGVTYMLPAQPEQPYDGASTIDPSNITFMWTLQTPPTAGPGARNARYVLLVFRADSLSNPVLQTPPLVPTGSSMVYTVNDPHHQIFQGDTDYIWMVGLYVDGEPRPVNDAFPKLRMVLSEQYHFRTGPTPPSPTAAGGARRGWWGETRTRRGR